MKKEIKWGIGLGSAIVAAGLLAVRLIKKLKKNSTGSMDNMTEDPASEADPSFDLDQDLEPAQERSYVSLHTTGQQEEKTEASSGDETENEAKEEAEKKATDVADADPSIDSKEESTEASATEE